VIVELRNLTSVPYTYSHENSDYNLTPGESRWIIATDTVTIKGNGSTAIVPYPSRRTRDHTRIAIRTEPHPDEDLTLVNGEFYQRGEPVSIDAYVAQSGLVWVWVGLCLLIALVLLVGILVYSGVSREKIRSAHF